MIRLRFIFIVISLWLIGFSFLFVVSNFSSILWSLIDFPCSLSMVFVIVLAFQVFGLKQVIIEKIPIVNNASSCCCWCGCGCGCKMSCVGGTKNESNNRYKQLKRVKETMDVCLYLTSFEFICVYLRERQRHWQRQRESER